MNDLIPTEIVDQPSKYGTDESFNAVAKQNAFFSRVQLYGSNSKLVKQNKIQAGHYGLVQDKDNVFDLTTEFNCFVLGWRPKALRIDGENTKAYYNPKTDVFKAIEADSGTPDSGCMYGPEFMIYIPDRNEFSTFFFGNPTFRRAAPKLRALMKKAATIGSNLIEKGKYMWHGPIITECTAPLNMPEDREAFVAQLTKNMESFNNPPESEVEAAEGSQTERPR